VTVYDVPQRFGQTTRRYTVVNGATVRSSRARGESFR